VNLLEMEKKSVSSYFHPQIPINTIISQHFHTSGNLLVSLQCPGVPHLAALIVLKAVSMQGNIGSGGNHLVRLGQDLLDRLGVQTHHMLFLALGDGIESSLEKVLGLDELRVEFLAQLLKLLLGLGSLLFFV
jgi:hypothetical protein